MTIEKIISGGQSGADQAALEVAQDFGIQTGGHCPKGFRNEYSSDGSNKRRMQDWGLVETPSDKYPPRTELNVKNSDGTVWFGATSSPGYKCTIKDTTGTTLVYLVESENSFGVLSWPFVLCCVAAFPADNYL